MKFGKPHTLAFITILACQHLLSNAQAPCRKGLYRPDPDGKCEICPMGSYQTGTDICRPCPPGRFGVVKAFRDDFLFFDKSCEPCEPGSFNPDPGAIKCRPCPRGTESGIGFKTCFRCKKGMQVLPTAPRNNIHAPLREDKCVNCSPGTFGDTEGNRACKPCAPGSISRAGASSCNECPKGTFSIGNNCHPCRRGTFSDEKGAVSCKICRPGTFSLNGADKCEPCPAGKFSATIASGACKNCPAGTDSLGIKPAACKDPVRGCTFSTFENEDGECEACMPGEKLDKAKKKCIPCASDEISEGGVASDCEKCPSDRVPAKGFSLKDGSTCVCRIGTQDMTSYYGRGQGNCRSCPPGTIGAIPGIGLRYNVREVSNAVNGLPIESSQRAEPTCIRCPDRRISVGSTSCKACPSGFVIRGNECEKCPEGSRSFLLYITVLLQDPRSATTCRANDTGCPINHILRKGRCYLKRCGDNEFFTGNGCKSCPPGTYRTSENRCRNCRRMQTSPGGAVTKCNDCPGNRVRFNNRCVCPTGTQQVGENCLSCPAGTFSDWYLEDCSPCPPGKFAYENGQSICTSCPSNSVTMGSGATRCIECPDGSKQGKNILGMQGNKCVPKDPYNKDPDLLAKLSTLQG